MFEDPKYSGDDPKIAADIVALMSEVYLLRFPSMKATDLIRLTHRCKSMGLLQQRLWVSYRLDSRSAPMVLQNCRRVV